MKMFKQTASAVAAVVVVVCVAMSAMVCEAKLLRHSRYYDDTQSPYDVPYGAPTGERAIMTVRGVRNPYDGSAPAKIAIEDNPYRGPYPRGVYDRLDAGYGPRGPRDSMYPMRPDLGGYSNYGGGYGGNYGGYGPMFGAPNRIAVTGVYPYGYGSRFA